MSTILLKSPILLRSPSQKDLNNAFERCSLRWEKDVLTVSMSTQNNCNMPALKNEAWIRECLERSPVKAVYLDQKLGQRVLKSWASICDDSGKQVYLKLNSANDLEADDLEADGLEFEQQYQSSRWQSVVNRAIAFCGLIILSPLIAAAAVAIKLESKGPAIIRQWHVSREGQLVRIYKFRSRQSNSEQTTRLGYWLRISKLDRLPKLINLVKGELCSCSLRTTVLKDFSYQ